MKNVDMMALPEVIKPYTSRHTVLNMCSILTALVVQRAGVCHHLSCPRTPLKGQALARSPARTSRRSRKERTTKILVKKLSPPLALEMHATLLPVSQG